jgi:MFS family permease
MDAKPFAALRIPDFRSFIIGRLCFITGLRIMTTVVAWWIYEVTRDPLAIGFIGLAEVIPAISLALYAGHVIDQNDRSRVLLVSVALFTFVILLIYLLSTSWAQSLWPQTTWVPILYGLIFCTGAIRAFSGSSFHAIIGQLIPIELLPRAITLNSGTFLIASILGHAFGGVLIAWIEVSGALLTALLLTVAACMILYQIRPTPPGQQADKVGTWASVKEGLAFVYRTKALFASMTLDLFAVLFGGAVAMIPAFAREILDVGPAGFGWLNAAADMGSMCTVISLTLFPLRGKQGKILLMVVAGFGLSIMLFGISKWYMVSFIALFCSGLLDGVSTIIRGTIAQLNTPLALKGRVMSVNSIFINSSNELGQFESGLAARIMGLVPSVIFGGGMTLLVVLVAWCKAPELKKLEY